MSEIQSRAECVKQRCSANVLAGLHIEESRTGWPHALPTLHQYDWGMRIIPHRRPMVLQVQRAEDRSSFSAKENTGDFGIGNGNILWAKV